MSTSIADPAESSAVPVTSGTTGVCSGKNRCLYAATVFSEVPLWSTTTFSLAPALSPAMIFWTSSIWSCCCSANSVTSDHIWSVRPPTTGTRGRSRVGWIASGSGVNSVTAVEPVSVVANEKSVMPVSVSSSPVSSSGRYS